MSTTTNNTETPAAPAAPDLGAERAALMAAINEGQDPFSAPPEASVSTETADKPAQTATAETTKPGDQTPASQSDYAKLKAEQAAKAEADKKAEADRAKQAEEARLAEQKRQEEAQRQPKSKFTPEQYENLAKEYEAENNPEMAKVARAEADRIRRENSTSKAEADRGAVWEKWQGNLKAEIAKDAALGDPKSDLHKGVEALLQQRRHLFTYPEGIIDAVTFVKANMAGARTAALEAEVTSLKAQLAEKEKLLMPGRGGPAQQGSETKFEDMTPEQQRAFILREARESDGN